MPAPRFGFVAVALVVTLSIAASDAARAEAPAAVALSGHVTSAEEGAMEGVVVSARRAGSTVTVSVVSDAQGHYAFPTERLAPGAYTLRIRAAGYELQGHAAAEIAAQPASVDLKLRKTGISRPSSPMPNGWRACPVPTTRRSSCSTASAATRSSGP